MRLLLEVLQLLLLARSMFTVCVRAGAKNWVSFSQLFSELPPPEKKGFQILPPPPPYEFLDTRLSIHTINTRHFIISLGDIFFGGRAQSLTNYPRYATSPSPANLPYSGMFSRLWAQSPILTSLLHTLIFD